MHRAPVSKSGSTWTVATSVPVAILGLVTLVGFGGTLWWPIDLVSHFRLHYAVALAAAASGLAIGRRRRWAGVAEEVEPSLLEAIENAGLPYQVAATEGARTLAGVVLLSKANRPVREVNLGGSGLGALEVEIRFDSVELGLRGVHLSTPTSATGVERRTRQLDAIYGWSQAAGSPAVVAGDFNSTDGRALSLLY